MSQLNDLIASLPDAALLIREGHLAAVNDLARHYLPQLEPESPLPPWFPDLEDTAPSSGVFTVGLSRYDFRLSRGEAGVWFTFHPAPSAALTDGQLDGVMRQLRTLMGDFMVQSGELSDPDHPDLRRSFHRLFRLVDNLDLLRLAGSGDGLPFHPNLLDLCGFCRRLCDQSAPLLRDAGIALEYRCDLPSLMLSGDGVLLRRLLLELISNAARVPGQTHLTLELRKKDKAALLTLTGNGTPPTPRQTAAMLQQDTDQALPMPGSGAGLGLALARQIALRHGGTLLVNLGQATPAMVLSLPIGPLDPQLRLNSPVQRDGGLSPLLVALSDVLPTQLFAMDIPL